MKSNARGNFLCPCCKQSFAEKNNSFPFCSERCKTIDLGAWAAEEYRIPSEQPIDEDFADDWESSKPTKIIIH